MPLQPLYDKVLIRQEVAPEKIGEIIVPDMAKEKPVRGIVIAIGEGRILQDGSLRSLAVKKDDLVLFNKYAGQPVDVDGENLLLLREEDILGVHLVLPF